MMFMKKNGGFTLVELIVVIAILAILAGVAVPAYSGYVEKANKQADISLAREIEHALTLAHYNGTLTKGATVTVYYGDNNVAIAGEGTDAAMKAVFGDGYAENLRLTYSGWDKEIGVAGDAATMAIVKDSNFTYDNLDNLLSQVQVVVGAAGQYLEGQSLSAEAADLLKSNGINISAGEKLTAETANAAANSYVYFVGSELADLEISANTNFDSLGDAEDAFLTAWVTNSVPSAGSFDVVTGSAAQYASIYALATYIDKNSGTTYATQMNEDTSGDPLKTAANVLAAIQGNNDVSDSYSRYQDEVAVNDAISFLAYMQGLDASTDSLMQSTNLMNSDYFVDGYVADYVNDYITVSDVLTANGNSGSSFAFLYTGEDVRCMPLDW